MLVTSNQTRPTCLTQIAREGSAKEYKDALQARGKQILDQAVDTFFQPDREIEDARKAMAGLEDLEGSLRAHLQRTRAAEKQNQTALSDKSQNIKSGEDPAVQLKPAGEEKLENQKPLFGVSHYEKGLLTDGKIADGRRVWEQERISTVKPNHDDMQGVGRFLADLAGVQGLYASVAMVPGPLSASVKTMAKEMMAAQGSFQSQHSSEQSSVAAGLLPLGIYRSGGTSQGSASGSHSLNYDKSTVDDRVVPVLMDLKDRLDQATVEAATTTSLHGVQRGREYVNQPTWFGLSSRDVHITNTYGTHHVERELHSQEYQPDRLWMPLTGTSQFTT